MSIVSRIGSAGIGHKVQCVHVCGNNVAVMV